MFLQTISKVKLYQLLFQIDSDLALEQKLKNCSYCGSVLHFSNYYRKPRGGPDNISDVYLLRHSLCCSNESCRKRKLPPSVRFWNRKVYWGVVIVVVLALVQSRLDSKHVSRVIKILGISKKTIQRWIDYFKTSFSLSSTWKKLKGRLGFYIPRDRLLNKVVSYFVEKFISEEEGLINSLKFLAGV